MRALASHAIALAGLVLVAGCADPAGPSEAVGAEDGDSPGPPGDTQQPAAGADATVFDLGEEDPVRWADLPDVPGAQQPASAPGGDGQENGSGAADDDTEPSDGSAPSSHGGIEESERQGACGGPPADPAFANAVGTSNGLYVRAPVGDPQTMAQVDVVQAGQGQNTDENQVEAVSVPDPTGALDHILRADVARVDAVSTVDADPRQSTQQTTAELLNVSVLDDLVVAQVIRADANTRATPSGATWDSDGSVLQGLLVNGEPTETSEPWFTLDLSETFGEGSKVALMETMGHVHTPVKPVDGFAADLKINMVHVVLRDIAPDVEGDQPVEVILSQVHSHSDFPEDPGCRPIQGVQGHAYNLHATHTLPAQPATVAFTRIARSGGDDERSYGRVDIGGNSVDGVHSSSRGDIPEGRSWTHAVSEVADVCLLRTEAGCTISATTVRAESFAEARSDGTQNAEGTTVILDLKAGDQDLCPVIDDDGFCRPEPNTQVEVPGVATIILNEQVTMPTQTPECHIGLKVRGIHVLPSPVVGRVVTTEAEAAAFYCPNPAELP